MKHCEQWYIKLREKWNRRNMLLEGTEKCMQRRGDAAIIECAIHWSIRMLLKHQNRKHQNVSFTEASSIHVYIIATCTKTLCEGYTLYTLGWLAYNMSSILYNYMHDFCNSIPWLHYYKMCCYNYYLARVHWQCIAIVGTAFVVILIWGMCL